MEPGCWCSTPSLTLNNSIMMSMLFKLMLQVFLCVIEDTSWCFYENSTGKCMCIFRIVSKYMSCSFYYNCVPSIRLPKIFQRFLEPKFVLGTQTGDFKLSHQCSKYNFVFWGDLAKSKAVLGALREDIRGTQNSALAIYVAHYFFFLTNTSTYSDFDYLGLYMVP